MARLEGALTTNNPMSLLWLDTEEGHDEDDELSVVQLARVHRQITTLFHFYKMWNERGDKEIAALEGHLDPLPEAVPSERGDMDIRFEYTVDLAVKAGKMVVPPMSGRTVERQHREWVANANKSADGVGSFKLDGRGKAEREWILNEEDLKRKFTTWMTANSKNLTKLSATAYVNDILLKDIPEEVLTGYYFLTLPISSTTTLAWMKICGAEKVWYKQNYYNDKHEDPEVIESRVKYTQVAEELELRQELWATTTQRIFFKKDGLHELQMGQEKKAADVYQEVRSC